jgi:hypothetical protein
MIFCSVSSSSVSGRGATDSSVTVEALQDES